MNNGSFVYHKLGNAQKQVILYLAKKGPCLIYDIASELSKDYGGTWRIVEKLEDLQIIAKIGTSKAGKNTYPTYWLTSRGIIHALEENANPDRILEIAKGISYKQDCYSKNITNQIEGIGFLCQASKLLGPQIIRAFGQAVLVEMNKKGKIELANPYEIRTIAFPTVVKKGAEIFELYDYLKKHPLSENFSIPSIKQLCDEINKYLKAE